MVPQAQFRNSLIPETKARELDLGLSPRLTLSLTLGRGFGIGLVPRLRPETQTQSQAEFQAQSLIKAEARSEPQEQGLLTNQAYAQLELILFKAYAQLQSQDMVRISHSGLGFVQKLRASFSLEWFYTRNLGLSPRLRLSLSILSEAQAQEQVLGLAFGLGLC